MKKRNIILITLDALRADHLGFYGYKENTSPFLDSFVKKGVVFKYAFSVGAATPQAFTGIMASTYPLDFGGYSPDKMEERTFVAEAMHEAGYYTMGFHSNAYLSHYFGYGRGWDNFQYLSHFKERKIRPGVKSGTWQFKLTKIIGSRHKISERSKLLGFLVGIFEAITSTLRKIYRDITNHVQAYYTAFEMNNAIKKKLEDRPDQPLFLWIHYMDAHDPYGLALRRGSRIIQKIKSYLCDYLFTFFGEYPGINKIFNKLYISMYDSGVKNIDNAIKELFEHLSSIGILNDESAVFITADHGEAFGEHGSFIHSQKVFNENIKVPLAIVAPEKFIGDAGESETPRSLIDLAPTLLEFAGVPKPSSFRGKNLLDKDDRDVMVEISAHEADLSGIKLLGGAVVSGGYKLIEEKNKRMLFSLSDKNEKNNLYDERQEIARVLEEKLRAFRDRSSIN